MWNGFWCPLLCPTGLGSHHPAPTASSSYSFQLQGDLSRIQGKQTQPEATSSAVETLSKWRCLISILVYFKEHVPQRRHIWTGNCGLSTVEAIGQTTGKEIYRCGKSWVWSHNSWSSFSAHPWEADHGDQNCGFYLGAALREVAADELLHSSSQLEAINTSCSSFFILAWKNFLSHSSVACRAALPSRRGTDDTVHWEVMQSVLEPREITAIFPVQRNSHQQPVRHCSEGAEKMSSDREWHSQHGHRELKHRFSPRKLQGGGTVTKGQANATFHRNLTNWPRPLPPPLQSLTLSWVNVSFIFLRIKALL